MAEKVFEVGKMPTRITYSDPKLERGGFLNIYSFCYAEDGGKKHCRDMMDRGHAAVVLPVNFATRELYMIEQGRHLRIFVEHPEAKAALKEAKDGGHPDPIDTASEAVRTLEVPAGIIDPGETAAQAAVRELQEESGIRVEESDLIEIATYYPSVGGSTETITAFFASLKGPVTHEQGHADTLERIIVWKMTFDEAFEALESGRIVTASSNIILRELRIRDLQRS